MRMDERKFVLVLAHNVVQDARGILVNNDELKLAIGLTCEVGQEPIQLVGPSDCRKNERKFQSAALHSICPVRSDIGERLSVDLCRVVPGKTAQIGKSTLAHILGSRTIADQFMESGCPAVWVSRQESGRIARNLAV